MIDKNEQESAADELSPRELATSLAGDIRQCEEYQDLIAAHDNLEENPESQQLLREYREQVRQKAMRGGKDPEGKVDELEEQIKNDQPAHDFVQAEQNWMDFIQGVFDIAGEKLDFNLRRAIANSN